MRAHKSTKNDEISKNNIDSDMSAIALEIRNFLSTLAESVTVNPAIPIRSKKIRRVQSENLTDSPESSTNEIKTTMTV